MWDIFAADYSIAELFISISGQAMGGTLSALASIADLALAKDVTTSALAYFLTADFFILICIVSYLLLPKLAYSRSVDKVSNLKPVFLFLNIGDNILH